MNKLKSQTSLEFLAIFMMAILSISPFIQADTTITGDIGALQQQIVALQQKFDTVIQQMEPMLIAMEKELHDLDEVYMNTGDSTALAHRDALAPKISTLRNSIQEAKVQRETFEKLKTKLKH